MSAAPKVKVDLTNVLSCLPSDWQKSVQILDIQGGQTIPNNPCNAIAVTSSIESVDLLNLAINNRVGHVCNLQNFLFEKDVQSAAQMILSPQQFVAQPLATVFNPNAQQNGKAPSHAEYIWEFSQARQKSRVLGDIDKLMSQIQLSNSVATEVRGVADELFTNAVYNAPFVDRVTQFNPGINRADQTVNMGTGKTGRIVIGVDAERIVVGCQDPFGALNVFTLLQKIRNCYNTGLGGAMNFGSGGAGIGSFMVFNSSASYYVGIISGVSTVILSAIPLKLSGRKRATLPRNINFFQIDGDKHDGTI